MKHWKISLGEYSAVYYYADTVKEAIRLLDDEYPTFSNKITKIEIID